MSPVYLYRHADPIDPFQDIVRECPEQFEVHQNIKEDALTNCPKCNGAAVRLIAGNVSVTWKNGAPTPKNYR